MNFTNVKINEIYMYKNLCELLGIEKVKAQNKRYEQFCNIERYCDIERLGNGWYRILEVYENPIPTSDKFFYKTMMIPVKCSRKDYEYLLQCNRWSADCWNSIVQADKEYYKENGVWMKRGDLQNFVKDLTPLHAVGNQHVFTKYYADRDAMFRSIKAKHENSSKMNLPYKQKRYFVTGWTSFCFSVDYHKNELLLAKKLLNGKKQNPVCCHFKNCPHNIVEIELVYKGRLYLAIKYKEPKLNNDVRSNGISAIDLGEIHSITSICGNGNAIIVTGRKIRSIRRLQDKEKCKLNSLMSHCKKGSNRYKKYSRALYKLGRKTDRQILDCVHKISKLYLDYCIENGISKVYYGDLDSCTRNTKGKRNKMVGQKLNNWCYGLLTSQLENKLSRYGIEFLKVDEYWTSQTCPHCGTRHKPSGRNYECECGYYQHRDIVGAMNILNFNEESIHIEKYQTKKYLRIA